MGASRKNMASRETGSFRRNDILARLLDGMKEVTDGQKDIQRRLEDAGEKLNQHATKFQEHAADDRLNFTSLENKLDKHNEVTSTAKAGADKAFEAQLREEKTAREHEIGGLKEKFNQLIEEKKGNKALFWVIAVPVGVLILEMVLRYVFKIH